MASADKIVEELERIDGLAEEINAPIAPVAPESAELAPEPVEAEAPTTEPKAEEKLVETSPVAIEAMPGQGVPSGVPIMPQTGEILKDTAGALDLLLTGMQARIVRGGIQEDAEQLGPLSMIMGLMKRAKDQADRLMGNGQQ